MPIKVKRETPKTLPLLKITLLDNQDSRNPYGELILYVVIVNMPGSLSLSVRTFVSRIFILSIETSAPGTYF